MPVVAEEVNVMGVPNVRILGTMGTLDEEQGA